MDAFGCGEALLDEWLERRALANPSSGASRTFDGAQGRHVGAALLQDAVQRVIAVAENAGVRALLVHALYERARQFYERYGFQASPMHPLTLMLRLPGPAER